MYIEYQRFQNGHMFWIRSINQVWVLYENSGRWIYLGRSQFDANPPPIVEAAPAGLFAPSGKFASVWSRYPLIRDGLGWAENEAVAKQIVFEYDVDEWTVILRDPQGLKYSMLLDEDNPSWTRFE